MSIQILDTEVNPNYFLLITLDKDTGVVRRWERMDDIERGRYSRDALRQFLAANSIITFNGDGYDQYMVAAYLAGFDNWMLFQVSMYIITTDMGRYKVLDEFGLDTPTWRHIDLMPVAPLMASLKVYGSRINVPSIQDMPVAPEEIITEITRRKHITYCINDCKITRALFAKLRPQLLLRKKLSADYHLNLMSKSDAQIAEGVLRAELRKLGVDAYPKTLVPEPIYHYTPPACVQFDSPELREALERVSAAKYKLSAKRSLLLPDELRAVIPFKGAKYKLGIGGLHSQEKKQTTLARRGETLVDLDVASYYPFLILNNELHPSTIGPAFSAVYQQVVERRIAAKRTGDTVTADSLKIVVNSSFGKFGNQYSALYDPQLLLQTTVTGQLYLLMLIEDIELYSSATVISANTDGVMVHCPTADAWKAVQVLAEQWQEQTRMTLEDTHYSAVYQQDVNNYLACYVDGGTKGKGLFAAPSLSKSPHFRIATVAASEFLQHGTPIRKSIAECTDPGQFCAARKVKGGGMWRGQALGATVRWYLASNGDSITYASNGNRVPDTNKAWIADTLPEKVPDNVDLEAYVAIANDIVGRVGCAHLLSEPEALAA